MLFSILASHRAPPPPSVLSCMAYVQGTPTARITSGQWLCSLAILLAIASCLCKETGATSFLVLIVIEIVRSENRIQSLVTACCIASIGASLRRI